MHSWFTMFVAAASTVAWAGDPGLEVSPVVPGHEVRLRAVGAPPASDVYLFVGRAVSPAASCPAVLSGTCLDLENAALLGVRTAAADGTASLTVLVPAALPWPTVAFQGVAVTSLGAAFAVPPVPRDVLSPDDDLDGDGLRNGDEVDAGADPLRADSDGGGIKDGQEVLVDSTDPTLASDDIPGERACDNGVDDDRDLRFDCADPNCAGLCPETSCADALDNDGDGAVDCADDDCAARFGCGEAVCDDGVDNDRNGLVDCEDLGCLDDPSCMEDDCDDGLDGDGDGLVDCEDDDCWTPACHQSALAWVTDLNSRFGPQYGGNVAGSVWTSNAPGDGRLCHFSVVGVTAISGTPVSREHVNVDPACGLARGFLPRTLTRASATSTTPRGDSAWFAGSERWYGTSSFVTTAYYQVRSDFTFEPSEPRGFCVNGLPMAVRRDRDRDSYGEDGTYLITGDPRRETWACRNAPGITLRTGDCNDLDRTWTPRNVNAQVTCNRVGPFDRDGDGRPAGRDRDDNDRGR